MQEKMKYYRGKDLTGKKFGRLLVIKEIGRNKRRQKMWLCKCICGNEKEVPTTYLTSGDTKSCGCYRRECEIKNLKRCRENGVNITHGLSKTRLYCIWAGMKERCYNNKSTAYSNYGGRGIRVCDEWIQDFMNFYDWSMANGYRDNLTIDRINVNGSYEPNNCRWATWKMQSYNKRNTKNISIFNEIKNAYEFEKQYGIKAELLKARYNKGYRDDKLIYKGNLGSFRKSKLKRDSKGRFLKKQTETQTSEDYKSVYILKKKSTSRKG